MTRQIVSLVLAMLFTGSASAHHSRAIFADDVISFEGEVVRFEWANPHSYIYVRALDADGATVEWELETQSTPGLARLGWTKDSLKPGERVTVRARPYRDASLHSAFAQALIKEDGSVLAPIFASSSAANPTAEAQNLWGVWRVVSARGRGFGGPNLSLPLTEKARAAAARYDARDDPMTECIPQTTPATPSATSTCTRSSSVAETCCCGMSIGKWFERSTWMARHTRLPSSGSSRDTLQAAGKARHSSLKPRISPTTPGALASAFHRARRSVSSNDTASRTAARR